MSIRKNKKIKRRRLFLFAKKTMEKQIVYILIFIFIVLALYQHRAFIYKKMDDWKLIPRPERFTELYFEDHINLPKEISKGEKISFSFTIHNLEGQTWEYPYAVYFKSDAGKITKIEEKSVLIKDEGSRTIHKSYIFALADKSGGIFVELQNPQQHINFLLADKQQ